MDPFEIESRRQGAALAGHVGDELGRLLGARAAEAEEVVGPTGHARPGGVGPMVAEGRIGSVAAFGRLDEVGAHAVGAGPPPVDVLLVAGHVDAVDVMRGGPAAAPRHGLRGAPARARAAAGGQRQESRI